ncbi:MAG: DNA-directed RNA polymerase subunit omega [Candidatus Binatia bacterium]
MARVTVEDCLKKVSNQFEVSILGAMRAHQLLKGATPLAKADNLEIIVALREIAAGKVRRASKEPRLSTQFRPHLSKTASESEGTQRPPSSPEIQ